MSSFSLQAQALHEQTPCSALRDVQRTLQGHHASACPNQTRLLDLNPIFPLDKADTELCELLEADVIPMDGNESLGVDDIRIIYWDTIDVLNTV